MGNTLFLVQNRSIFPGLKLSYPSSHSSPHSRSRPSRLLPYRYHLRHCHFH